MLRWFILLLALLMFALSSLVIITAPTLLTWKLAILAGEYGHWLAGLALVLAMVIGVRDAGDGVAAGWLERLALAACVVAVGLFLKPVMHATLMGARLPSQLQQAFGKGAAPGRPAFSWRALIGKPIDVVPAETKLFSDETNGEKLAMDFYRPKQAMVGRYPDRRSSPGVPCVVIMHAGGWDSGDRGQFQKFNHWLVSLGYAVAAIDYRLAPKHIWPAQRDDLRAALDYLKKHASELGIDAGRLVLMGRSAGGQLAESVAYGFADPAIRGVIAFYAPADLNFAWKYTSERDVLDSFKLMKQYLGGAPDAVQAAFDEASPYRFVIKNSPPTLLAHGKLDGLVWHRQSERLAARLAENGVPCYFLDLPWATHAFDFNLDGPGGQLATYAVEGFLASVTRP